MVNEDDNTYNIRILDPDRFNDLPREAYDGVVINNVPESELFETKPNTKSGPVESESESESESDENEQLRQSRSSKATATAKMGAASKWFWASNGVEMQNTWKAYTPTDASKLNQLLKSGNSNASVTLGNNSQRLVKKEDLTRLKNGDITGAQIVLNRQRETGRSRIIYYSQTACNAPHINPLEARRQRKEMQAAEARAGAGAGAGPQITTGQMLVKIRNRRDGNWTIHK